MRRPLAVTLLAAATVALAGCLPPPSGGAQPGPLPPQPTTASAPAPAPSTTDDADAAAQVWPQRQASHGVILTSEGVLDTGVAGPQRVDADTAQPHAVLYLDFQCPHCASFAAAFDDLLEARVASGAMALELRALSFLDRGESAGPSARAAAAFAAVADEFPEAAWPYARLLLANQASGFDDETLLALAAEAGASSAQLTERVEGRQLLQYAVTANETGLSVPPSGAASAPTGTPALYLDGEPFQPVSGDPAELEAWLDEHGA